MKIERPVCNSCGSHEVLTNAYGAWDDEIQDWVLHSTYTGLVCNECGSKDCEFAEVEISKPVPPFEYHVGWNMELDANSPEDAARKALRIHRDPESIATVFHVRKCVESPIEAVAIDLEDLND